jgi:predicted NAD-dependent protein-ADP-ribosyltransferase YbiA (DUF1768 family)
MLTALREKFRDPELKRMLLETGEAPLVQTKPDGRYWGTGPDGAGGNRFGELLEQLRTQLE